MPELPEVKAHAERLQGEFGGAVLERFRALNFTTLKTFDPPPEAGQGHPLASVSTRGKFICLDFGPVGYLVHLMQGGRLRPDPKQAAKPRGGMARWVFDDGRALMLSEAGKEHSAGVWVYAGSPDEL
ncbi:MAG: Fpg/Nei family DNA glycosylase, partial [Acidimicrobiales bacterium]|nr:Fpg/Nei family DNA glycosylase [Acidimicrobiales bacterium]